MTTATIEECFEKSATKKRELSNTSIEDDNAKKLKEGSLNSTLDTNDKSEEVFTNDSGLEEHGKSLFDTVKEMQRQILTLTNTTNEVKERQINFKIVCYKIKRCTPKFNIFRTNCLRS